jgi:hypothetical protein
MIERMRPKKIEAYGTGTIVISPHRPGMVLAVEEKIDKPATGRRKGQLSIPLETAVVIAGKPERSIDTIRASLAEITDDQGVADVGERFDLVANGRFYVPSKNYPGVQFRTALVVYDGDPEYPFAPIASDEVMNCQWVPAGEFTRKNPDEIRPLAGEVVVYEASRGSFLKEPQSVGSVFSPGFSLQKFYDQRSQHPDNLTVYE